MKRPRIPAWLALIMMLVSVRSFAQNHRSTLPTDRSLYVVVFGDSITRGVMGDEKMGAPGPRYYKDMVRGALSISFGRMLEKLFGWPAPSEADLSFFELNFNILDCNSPAIARPEPVTERRVWLEI